MNRRPIGASASSRVAEYYDKNKYYARQQDLLPERDPQLSRHAVGSESKTRIDDSRTNRDPPSNRSPGSQLLPPEKSATWAMACDQRHAGRHGQANPGIGTLGGMGSGNTPGSEWNHDSLKHPDEFKRVCRGTSPLRHPSRSGLPGRAMRCALLAHGSAGRGRCLACVGLRGLSHGDRFALSGRHPDGLCADLPVRQLSPRNGRAIDRSW